MPKRERETCLAALEQQQYVEGRHGSGRKFLRTKLTERGRLVLGRPDVSLTEGLFAGSSAPTYDQRMEVKADTFNNHGGQV